MRKIFLGGISCLQAPAYGASPGPNLAAVYRYKVASLLSANFLGVPPPNPAHFFCVKRNGGKKPQFSGIPAELAASSQSELVGYTPVPLPVGLLAQKAGLRHLLPLLQSSWPCSPCF